MKNAFLIVMMVLTAWTNVARAADDNKPGSAASAGATSVLAYLREISGKATVAGIHNREPNSSPSKQTERMTALAGHQPGLWSGDFLFSKADVESRWTMIRECKRQWDNGSIVQLMAHVAPPNQPEVCDWKSGVMSHLSNEQWKDLINDSGVLNKVWKSRLDGYAVYLDYLKTNGVIVLFRPLQGPAAVLRSPQGYTRRGPEGCLGRRGA